MNLADMLLHDYDFLNRYKEYIEGKTDYDTFVKNLKKHEKEFQNILITKRWNRIGFFSKNIFLDQLIQSLNLKEPTVLSTRDYPRNNQV